MAREPEGSSRAAILIDGLLDIQLYYSHNTPMRRHKMLEDPVARRTAISAGVGALIAIPVPFVGPIFGALAGAAYGFFTAKGRR